LCQQFLSQKVQELGNVARHAILHPQDENVEAIFPDENDSDKDDEESCNNRPDSNTGLSGSQSNLEKLKRTIKSLNSTISSWVKQNHHCYTIDKTAVANLNKLSTITISQV
jgi:microcompartment protein CcmL/EutN